MYRLSLNLPAGSSTTPQSSVVKRDGNLDPVPNGNGDMLSNATGEMHS
jgi:hypothetical protein